MNGAVGLAGDVAGFERELAPAPIDFDAVDIEHVFQLSFRFFGLLYFAAVFSTNAHRAGKRLQPPARWFLLAVSRAIAADARS